MSAASDVAIDARLEHWLTENDVPFEVHRHAPTYSALATARAEGVEPRTFAKVVGVTTTEGRVALVVLDASDELDFHKLEATIGSPVRLLSEPEMAEATPPWEVGTVPPIPHLAGIAVFADDGVRSDERISFAGGSHEIAVRVDRAAWEAAAGIVYGDLARRGRRT